MYLRQYNQKTTIISSNVYRPVVDGIPAYMCSVGEAAAREPGAGLHHLLNQEPEAVNNCVAAAPQELMRFGPSSSRLETFQGFPR